MKFQKNKKIDKGPWTKLCIKIRLDGQIKMYNRIYDSMNKGKNDIERARLVFKELNSIRNELVKEVNLNSKK